MNKHSSAGTLQVVCLILCDQDEKVLITQRHPQKALGLLWEFPGGKIERGENAEESLRREIFEEICVKISAVEELPWVEHDYYFGRIRLIPFISRCLERPKIILNEHQDSKWIHLDDWHSFEWAPADIPIIHYLIKKGLTNV